jgi:hypothetical protein
MNLLCKYLIIFFSDFPSVEYISEFNKTYGALTWEKTGHKTSWTSG